MTRPAGFLARALAPLLGLGALAVAAGARADDLPLPGPVVDGPVAKLPPGEPANVGEPLWELGIGVAAVRFPDYRGSD
ncbi:MAG: hypothetical protein M3Z15_11290, partial [Pseudomonadota bacterium]|nr:hypothetical protein [Pseudomonadota bacterium]